MAEEEEGHFVEVKHLPQFQALMTLHQNILSRKVDATSLQPFKRDDQMRRKLMEMINGCNDKLQAYSSTRSQSDQFQYTFCLAGKVCDDAMDEWTECFQDSQEKGYSLDRCESKKVAAEKCGMNFVQRSVRLFVEADLFPKNRK